jgi:hypothetical protein
MPSNYGIVASSVVVSSVSSEPTSISLFGKIYTEDTNTSTSYITSADTNASPDFSIYTDYYDPEWDPGYIQNVTLEATLLDSIGNPVSGQSVYFYLTPLYGGSPIQFGTSSLDAGTSQTMVTDSNGKIQDVYSAIAWVNEDYGSYTIRAVFDGNPEGTLMNSNSPTGRIYFASS